MKSKFVLISGAAVLFAAGLFGGTLLSQNAENASAKSDDFMTKMMEECMKYGTPGVNHDYLKPLIGKWNLSNKFWMDPSGPEMTSSATSERTWILGGRYVEEKHTGEWEGQTFEGRGIMGYDNFKKVYHHYWLDNMSTVGLWSTGSSTTDGKTINLEGTFPNPFMEWKDGKVKMEFKVIDNDKHVFTMYMPHRDGKLFKHMEITYTRVK